MVCCTPTQTTLRIWSSLGILSALLQMSLMAVQYHTTRSWAILACLLASVFYALGYFWYIVRIRRPGYSSWLRDKYFLISHLLISTWYFWIALQTFLLHTADVQIFVVIANSGISGTPKSFISALFAFTICSLVVDIYTIIFHTRHILPSAGRTVKDRPRNAALLTLLVDIALIILSGLSWSYTRDNGTWVLVLLGVASFIAQGRYMWQLWTAPSVDIGFHINGQLLHLQHELITSTIFLVNFMLILMQAMGLSLSSIVAQDTANEGTQVILSIIAYVGIAVSTIALVGIHTGMENPENAEAYDAAAFHAQAAALSHHGGVHGDGYHAVPVALAEPVAMPVALD